MAEPQLVLVAQGEFQRDRILRLAAVLTLGRLFVTAVGLGRIEQPGKLFLRRAPLWERSADV